MAGEERKRRGAEGADLLQRLAAGEAEAGEGVGFGQRGQQADQRRRRGARTAATSGQPLPRASVSIPAWVSETPLIWRRPSRSASPPRPSGSSVLSQSLALTQTDGR